MADEKYSEYVPYGANQPVPESDPSQANIQSMASMHAQAINRSRQAPENPPSSQAPAGYVAYVAPNSGATASQSPRREAPVQTQQTFRGYVAVASLFGLDALKDSVEIYRENRQNSTVGAGAPKAPSHISGGDTMVAVPQNQAPSAEDLVETENLKYEHSLAGVPICVSNNELTIIVGRGTAWYFRFIKFLWFINFVLFLLSLINIIPQLDDVRKLPSDEKPRFPYMFYLDSYQSDLKRPWMGSCVLSVIFLFFAGPMYSMFISWTQRRQARGDDRIVEDPFEGQYSVDSDDCIDKIPYEVQPLRSQQLLRRFFSLCVFGVVLLLQAIVTYYLQQALSATSSSRAATAIAAVMSFINLCWKTICAYLTRLELHLYYSSFRRWEVMKVFVFKLLNVLVLFFVKRYEVLTNTDNCPLFLMADQFLLLLLFDIAIGIFVDLFLPFFYNCFIVRRLRVKENEADDANKVEWNLADEYVGVMYRQFLVSLGLLVNPMLPCVALLGNILEYYVDRYRLLRVVERPKRTKSTFKNVLMFFFFLVWLCVLLTFPNGVIWILSGVAIQDRCAIFQ